jgi:hypothetical protein
MADSLTYHVHLYNKLFVASIRCIWGICADGKLSILCEEDLLHPFLL